MRALVVYYSRTGHTRKIAEEIARELQCDTDEIIDTVNRSGPVGYIMSGRQARKNELTKIKPVRKDAAQYDLVIIGSPVWFGSVSVPVRTYILENREKFRKVAFFVTFGGTGTGSTLAEMEESCGRSPAGTLAVNSTAIKEQVYLDSVRQFTGGFKGAS